MPLVPNRFLVVVSRPCLYVKNMPDEDAESILDLPDSACIRNFAELDGRTDFADLRLAWNELGLGVQCTVRGKSRPPVGDGSKPRSSDGLTLWLDTRDSRSSHRASRYCHQFHFLPVGSGTDFDEPTFTQTKINRAQQDAPLCGPADVVFRHEKLKGGWRIEAFLPVAVLTGYDPEQHPRLGMYYQVRDLELGNQYLGVGEEFPFSDDPSLWEPLELVK